MFGRARRAALAACPDVPIQAYGLLHSYSPATDASMLAAGMGAGAIGGGAATATAEALDIIQRAGRTAQHRYVTLPGHVLVIVTATEVQIWRWNTASSLGEKAATWPKGSFNARWEKYGGQDGVRVVLDSGLIALLTGTASRTSVQMILDAIGSMARGRG